jgi:hypothetical protein
VSSDFKKSLCKINKGGKMVIVMIKEKKISKFFFMILTSFVLILCANSSSFAKVDKQKNLKNHKAESVLWIGNSFFYFNNSMHSLVSSFAKTDDAKSPIRGVSVTISGSGLDWHDIKSYLRPGGIGRYSFVGDNEIAFNKSGKQFDTVMVMDCSQCPIHPKLSSSFFEAVKKSSYIIRKNGAEPVLFMSWAYKDKPDMIKSLADAYKKAGKDNTVLVVPAGLAFANSISKRPDLELYQTDKRHPSLAGSYLAAATVYASLFKKNPVDSKYTAGLDLETAKFLRSVAWETVQEENTKF